MPTPEQIAILASELEACRTVGEYNLPIKLANRILVALREFERERREWVSVERME
jgi:hypothetical protein